MKPGNLLAPAAEVCLNFLQKTKVSNDVKKYFPNIPKDQQTVEFVQGTNEHANLQRKIGIIFSGGQAPGGHNVISGIFDALTAANTSSTLIGFLNGPSGLVENNSRVITRELVDQYRNTGGFDMIGSGRTKIETPEQFEAALQTCKQNKIDALIVIGGDDSNTNALLLDEYFRSQDAAIQVIGVPKTIDGDLKNEHIECSFGFDTATKVYSEQIGNIGRDAMSARKYWHFIRLMGRSASHIALECALQTQPNVCIISEEVAGKKKTLAAIVKEIAQTIIYRADRNEHFGIVLLPEGLIEFIPEIKTLIGEINQLLVEGVPPHPDAVSKNLRSDNRTLFRQLPDEIRQQLLFDRDPHGNVQVSRIETEKLILHLLTNHLEEYGKNKEYSKKFSWQTHFFGYEGRAAFPSNFDADYCYALGQTAFFLIANDYSGYIATVRNLSQAASEWIAGGAPLISMIHLEKRHGIMKPVIKKSLVDLKGKSFLRFAEHRERWAQETNYLFPGPIQYFGPLSITHVAPFILR